MTPETYNAIMRELIKVRPSRGTADNLCLVRNDGFVCSLVRTHVGSHEAWDADVAVSTWPQQYDRS